MNTGGITPKVLAQITPAAGGGFTTPDGMSHPTWGDARRHLTNCAIVQDVIRSPIGSRITTAEAQELVSRLLERWHITLRSGR